MIGVNRDKTLYCVAFDWLLDFVVVHVMQLLAGLDLFSFLLLQKKNNKKQETRNLKERKINEFLSY